MMKVAYRYQAVRAGNIFYRESGPPDAPVLLLLHGFPSSSHMFRDLIPLLNEKYRVIAPDLPGFENAAVPERGQFLYTFDNLASVIEDFIDTLSLDTYVLYAFDYGAPIGYRIAVSHPERVIAIVSQNGNAYQEGFSDQWDDWRRYWHEPNVENREACRPSLSPEAIREWQYGTPTSVYIRSSTNIFATIGRHCWPPGADMTPPSYPLVHKPTHVTCRMLRFTCWIRGILH